MCHTHTWGMGSGRNLVLSTRICTDRISNLNFLVCIRLACCPGSRAHAVLGSKGPHAYDASLLLSLFSRSKNRKKRLCFSTRICTCPKQHELVYLDNTPDEYA